MIARFLMYQSSDGQMQAGGGLRRNFGAVFIEYALNARPKQYRIILPLILLLAGKFIQDAHGKE
jgi:hypothetical protein